MFSSIFARCTQTEWVSQQQALRRSVAEAPASDLPKLLASSQGQDTDSALFTARMDSTTGATIWHIAAERPKDQTEALLQLHAAYTSLAPASVRSKSKTLAFSLPDKQGRTPLMIACHQGKLDAVNALLSWGANPIKEMDKRGRLPLHLAAQSGGEVVVKALLQWARDNDPATASSQSQQQQEEQQRGDQAEAQDQTRPRDRTSPEQLLEQSEQEQQAQAQEQQADGQELPQPQLELNTDVPVSELCRSMACAADLSGLTPLHYAAASNNVASCQHLLDAGASVAAITTHSSYDNTMPCNSGMTPLHVAAMNNSFQAAHMMLVAWGRVSVVERVRQFPLVPRGTEGSGKFTLDPRVIMDKEGKTACMVAACRRFDALTQLLDPTQPMPGAARASGSGTDGRASAPLNLCCPITMDLMEDPVVIGDGFSYERAAIEKWLKSNATSPLTNVPLANKGVFPNRVLRQAIADWRQANNMRPLPKPQDPKSPVRARGSAGPVLQGGRGDGFIREMADGGAPHGRRR